MSFSADEDFAHQLDAEDLLRAFREKFYLPLGKDGTPLIYFAGNSLGLMPKSARQIVEQELDDWAKRGVDAHHGAGTPWYSYQESLREPTARLVGAQPNEVVCMNSLTVHILARPRKGEFTIRQKDIEAALDKHGEQLAVVMMGGLNFFTGQMFDIEEITALAQKRGCAVGFDLAHAIGNVPLALHDWNVDFAVWCSYKYLNAGPGAVAGAFVHERHATNTKLPRLAGWFGNDPNTRFRLHLEPEFVPVASADGWQISNPPIFAMAPLRASLAIFDEAGAMEQLRANSIKLTGYLEFLIEQIGSKKFSIITPADPNARGAQLSIKAHEHPKQLHEELIAAGVKCDFREPNVIRAAPTPLYNTFHEVWRFAKILAAHK